MSTFPLRIGTPDGLLYEGEVARLVCRTINGDLAILPRQLQLLYGTWHGRSPYCTGRRQQEECSLVSAGCFL